MKEIGTVGIVGAGAIGLLVGEPLTKRYGKERVFFIADAPRQARYRARSFTVNGRPFAPAVRTPGEAGAPCGLLIFAVKAGQLDRALGEARPFAGPDTLLLSLMNGISSEAQIAAAYRTGPLLLAVGQGMDATRTGGSLTYRSPGDFSIGEPDNRPSERLGRVRRCLGAAGIRTDTPADMSRHLWSKFMLNCGINQVLAVHRGTYALVQRDPAVRAELVAAMGEVAAVAAAEQVTLTGGDIDAWLAVLDAINPDGMPSMAQDIRAGRATEKELFSGTVRALGAKHGVPTPVNDRLYAQLARLEGDARQG